jgi:hypothetical protein
MIEPRAMARELQEQLTGAVKASQEQFRKGQETAASAVRTWTDTAKSVRTHLPRPTLPAAQLPKLPTLADVRQAGAKLRDVKLPEVRLPKLPAQPLNRIASTDELAEGAERLANRVLVTQLKFAGRTLHNAAPVIADGAAFLTRAADRVALRVQPATEARADDVVEIAEVVELAPAAEASTAEASPAKAGTAKASPAKPRVTRASSPRTGTAKAAATKAPAKANSTARKAKTTKK